MPGYVFVGDAVNIWLVTIGEPLPLDPDVRKLRTGMLADCLVEKGHTLRWWVSDFEHQRKKMVFESDREVSLSNRLTLQVLHGSGYHKNISLSRYLDHRILAHKFSVYSPKVEPPDVIVASIPCHHLAYETVRYAHSRKIPVLIDVRDLWPDVFLDYVKNNFLKRIVKFFLRNDFARLKNLLKNADALLAISNGCLQWGLEKAGRQANQWDRVFYLGYEYKQGSSVNVNDAIFTDWLREIKNKKILVFIGTFGMSYELPLLVQAARRMQNSGMNELCFVIAGTGEQEQTIRRETRGLSNVILPGWIGSSEIQMLLSRGYAGLLACRSIEHALPNKTLEYLSAGLPVISSLEGEMADMIAKYKLGFNYSPGDLEGLCNAITVLASDQLLHDEMSINALAFFQKYGDANVIYTTFAKHIEAFVQSRDKMYRYAGNSNHHK